MSRANSRFINFNEDVEVRTLPDGRGKSKVAPAERSSFSTRKASLHHPNVVGMHSNHQDIRRQFIYAVQENMLTHMASFLRLDKKLVNSLDEHLFAPLHYAAKYDREAAMALLIRHGANVNIRGSDNIRPLHLVAKFNHENSAKTLLSSKGIHIDASDDKGQTPFLIASRRRALAVAQLLVKAGADVNKREKDNVSALHQPTRIGDLSFVKYLIDAGVKIDYADSNGITPLMIASAEGRVDIFKFLFDIAKDRNMDVKAMINKKDGDGASCIHHATQNRQLEILAIITKLPIDVDARKNDGNSSLHIACSLGFKEVVNVLLDQNPEVNIRDRKSRTPLHECGFNNNCELARILADHGADVDAADNDYRTPLHLACEKGHVELMHLLLEKGANIHKKDIYLRSALHLAVQCGYLETVKQLIACCNSDRARLNLINAQDNIDQTALHYAVIQGDTKILQELLNKGADISLTNNEEKGPFHLAAKLGQLDCLKAAYEHASRLVSVARDSDEYSALLIAAAEGRKDVFFFLCEKGVDYCVKDEIGRTSLMLASLNGAKEIVHFLLDKDTDVNALDQARNTSLHYAARENKGEIIELLLENGAVLTENNQMDSPLDVALKRKCWDAAKTFLGPKYIRTTMEFRHHKNGRNHMNLLIETSSELSKIVLDSCIRATKEDVLDPDYSVIYDFQYLDPGPDDETVKRSTRYFALQSMCTFKQEELLNHPLSKVLLESKWKRSRGIYIADILFYLLFLAIITSFVLVTGPPTTTKVDPATLCPLSGTNATSQSRKTASTKVQFLKIAILVLVSIRLLIEGIKLISKRHRYFIDIQIYFLNTLYATTLGFILPIYSEPCIRDWLFGAVSVMLAWLILILMLEQTPLLRIYVIMFQEVLLSLLKVMILYAIIVMAFGTSFYILLRKNDPFSSFGYSFMKTIDMSMGDLEFVTYFESSSNGYFGTPAQIIFVVFCLFLNIAMLNFLIGLAVGDIDGIRKEAALRSLSIRVNYVWEVETKIPHYFQRKLHYQYEEIHPNRSAHNKLSTYLSSLDSDGVVGADNSMSFEEIPDRLSAIEDRLLHIQECNNELMYHIKPRKSSFPSSSTPPALHQSI